MWLPVIATTAAANRILLIIAQDNRVYYALPGNWNYDNYEYRPTDEEVRWENLAAPTSAKISAATGRLTFSLPGEAARQYSPAVEF
jgi:hypothetical protein